MGAVETDGQFYGTPAALSAGGTGLGHGSPVAHTGLSSAQSASRARTGVPVSLSRNVHSVSPHSLSELHLQIMWSAAGSPDALLCSWVT